MAATIRRRVLSEADVVAALNPRHGRLFDPRALGDLGLGEFSKPPQIREPHRRGGSVRPPARIS